VLLLITISYFFVNAINLGVYLYTPELYPTRARALGVGARRRAAPASMIDRPQSIHDWTGLHRVYGVRALAVVTALVTACLPSKPKSGSSKTFRLMAGLRAGTRAAGTPRRGAALVRSRP